MCLNADSQVCCISTSPERTLSNSLFIALQFKQFVKGMSSFAPSQNLARRVYGCFEVFLEIFFKLFKGCFKSFYTQQVLPDSSRVMWFGYMIFPKKKSILRKDLKLQILFARRAQSRKRANLPRREAETLRRLRRLRSHIQGTKIKNLTVAVLDMHIAKRKLK